MVVLFVFAILAFKCVIETLTKDLTKSSPGFFLTDMLNGAVTISCSIPVDLFQAEVQDFWHLQILLHVKAFLKPILKCP